MALKTVKVMPFVPNEDKDRELRRLKKQLTRFRTKSRSAHACHTNLKKRTRELLEHLDTYVLPHLNTTRKHQLQQVMTDVWNVIDTKAK